MANIPVPSPYKSGRGLLLGTLFLEIIISKKKVQASLLQYWQSLPGWLKQLQLSVFLHFVSLY
jgi:hypothetical protein